MKRSLVLACLAVMVCSSVRAHAEDVPGNPGWPYFATNFNAVVFGDLATSGGSCENRLAVEGTAHFTGGYSVGIVSYGLPLPVYTNAQTDIMIVGGDLYDGAFSVNGNIVHGGTRYGPFRWMPNGNTVEQVVPVTLEPDGNVHRAGIGFTWESLLAQACAMSEAMAALPDSGVVAKQLDDPWEALLCGTNVLLNVFNVDAPDWSRRSSTIHIEAPAGSTVLVNIHGASVAITNSLIQLSGVDRRHVVYNYADALSLSTKSFLHEGSLLAPCADASFLYGGVAGTAVLGGDVVASGFAFLNHPFAGADPANGGTDPETPTMTLSVVSEHGACQPAAGSHVFEQGETVVCAVTNSPQVSGWSHYACTGWRGTGSVPESGSAQQCSVALQMDSTIEWTWATNHWVSLGVEGEGSLSASSGWHPVGSALQISATPVGAFDRFVRWSGDVGEASPTANPLAVSVDRPLAIQAVFGSTLPPDPADVAPPVRRGEVSILARNIDFLYTGENPIQTGVDTNAFDVKRMAVVRGRVLNRDGEPLPGVAVSVYGHPEFGRTLSRLDGGYDMAVNGGGLVSLDFARDGYLRARRSSQASWQDYAVFPDVSLVTADPVGTLVDFGGSSVTSQVARASVVADDDGTRQATVIIPPGVQAYLVDAVGATQAVDALTLRFTEYTVGTNGPACMPAELPSSSFYTYCVELAADEAGDASVHFSGPVSFYVENFVGMPVGGNVPAAYYRFEGRPGWIPEQDGVVLQIVGIDGNGLAEVDVTGDGAAEDGSGLAAYELTEAERLELGRLYDVGDSLWRVQTAHFSPWDLNYPFYVSDGVKPDSKVTDEKRSVANPSAGKGGGFSLIENASFGEVLPIPGTGLTLHYLSSRVSASKQVLRIRPFCSQVPEAAKQVVVDVIYAGKVITRVLSRAEAANDLVFELDTEDSYGRKLVGAVRVEVAVRAIYEGFYGMTSKEYSNRLYSFAAMAGEALPDEVKARTDVTLGSQHRLIVSGAYQSNGFQRGLGGWSLGVWHSYDPIGRCLYLGSGAESSPATHRILNGIQTAAGSGVAGNGGDGGPARRADLNVPADICVATDGSLYIADSANNRIRKVSPDGMICTFAGTGDAGYSGDGGPAVAAKLDNPTGVAVCEHGIVYVSDAGNHAIRKITPDGVIHTIAGTGTAGFSGDGGPAAMAMLDAPAGIAVNGECSVYIADSGNGRVRRIGPDKRMSTVAGNGSDEYAGPIEGQPALDVVLPCPEDVAIGEDGALLVSDSVDGRVIRVGNDGIATTAYPYQIGVPYDQGAKATNGNDAEKKVVFMAAVGQGSYRMLVASNPESSSVYVVDYNQVYEVLPDGTTRCVAGGGWENTLDDGMPATAVYLGEIGGLAFGPDGVLYIADRDNNRIRSVKFDYPGFDNDEIAIASEDGSQLYVFDAAGRHLRTLDSVTLKALHAFAYTEAGVLSSITDAEGMVTTVERDSNGNPQAIVGPFGHRTEFVLDANGWLVELINPAGETNFMSYADGGLLTNVVSRRGSAFREEYDDEGRFVKNSDPLGLTSMLIASANDTGWEVEVVDGLSRTNRYCVERDDDGTETRTSIDAAGLMTIKTTTPEGDITVDLPDWSYTTLKQSPDPRFGMQSPMVTESQVQTWDRWNYQTFSRTVALADPNNPLSLTNQIDVANVNGREWRNEYCHPDRTIIATSPMGRWSRVKMDESGRPVLVESPGIHAVSNAYDALGRIVKTVQGEGAEAREVNFEYAPDGTLRSVVNPLGETLLTFSDEIGRVADQILPDSSLVSFEYDRSSDPVKIILPHGEEHGFGHNPVGQTERYSAPPAGSVPTNTLWTYNVARQPVATIKPDGTVISNAYDSAGRLVSVTASRGGESDAVEYAYDEAWLDQVTRDGEAIAYGYDCFLTTDEWTPDHDLNWEYDDDFRVVGVALDDTYATAYGYDDDGALVFAGDLALNRDAATGFLTNTVVGNVADSRAFNGFGEIADYAVTASASSLYSATYTRDALGRVASQTETLGGATTEKVYDYDVRGRLTSVTTGGVVTEWYAYDRNGNRTNSMNGAAIYDAQDRMLAGVGMSFTYDLNGSQTNRTINGQTTGIAYDLFGQLKSVTLPDDHVVSYDRDALSRITAKRVDGIKVKGWIYKDALKPIAETDAAGNVVSFFVYGTSGLSPDYMIRDGVTYRFIRDVQGSVRLVVDAATGAIAQRLDYDSFGNVLLDTNPGFQPFGFQSGLYDSDTALVQFGARWYDAASGRWLSKDPILLEGGLNLYVFCGNDPVNFADPWGLLSFYDAFSAVSDFCAGAGDVLSFGATRMIRDSYPEFYSQDYGSGAYVVGEVSGVALSVAIGGAGAAKGVAKVGSQSLRGQLYEIGQKTLTKGNYEYFYARNADPVRRGIDIVRQQGWLRAKLPSPLGLLTQSGKTIRTGLTPQAAQGLAEAAAVFYGSATATYGIIQLQDDVQQGGGK